MEFEALLQQLGELEKLNREEERKLIEETQRHEATKKELERALTELKVQKEKEVLLLEKLTACQTEKENDAKTIKQLKEAIKNSKKENELLRESTEKEIAATKEKRAEFLKKMEAVNNELRRLRQLYLQHNIKVEEIIVQSEEKESKKSVEGDHDAAMKTIQQLEEKVSLLEKEKEMLSKKYESLMNERTNEQRQNVEESNKTIPSENTRSQNNLDGEEMEKLKKQLVEKEAELSAAFKELEKLDQYSKTLEDNLYTFQEYFTQIEQFVKELKCPKCHVPIKVTIRQPTK